MAQRQYHSHVTQHPWDQSMSNRIVLVDATVGAMKACRVLSHHTNIQYLYKSRGQFMQMQASRQTTTPSQSLPRSLRQDTMIVRMHMKSTAQNIPTHRPSVFSQTPIVSGQACIANRVHPTDHRGTWRIRSWWAGCRITFDPRSISWGTLYGRRGWVEAQNTVFAICWL